MNNQFYLYLVILVVLSFYGLYFFKKLSKPYQYLVILICAATAFESFGRVGMFLGMKNSYLIYHLSITIFILMNLLIYFKIFEFSSRAVKRGTIMITAFVLVATVLNSFFYQKLDHFPSIGISLHALQTIILSLLVFQEMIKQPVSVPLQRQPLFWLIVGNLLFYTINFLVFAFLNFYREMKDVYIWLMQINWFGNLLLYTCYFRALYLDKNRVHADR